MQGCTFTGRCARRKATGGLAGRNSALMLARHNPRPEDLVQTLLDREESWQRLGLVGTMLLDQALRIRGPVDRAPAVLRLARVDALLFRKLWDVDVVDLVQDRSSATIVRLPSTGQHREPSLVQRVVVAGIELDLVAIEHHSILNVKAQVRIVAPVDVAFAHRGCVHVELLVHRVHAVPKLKRSSVFCDLDALGRVTRPADLARAALGLQTLGNAKPLIQLPVLAIPDLHLVAIVRLAVGNIHAFGRT
mmetsp:Transcript_102092/g.263978  ORF Transcript_102092/g.263978 Transcript_102092/m.263978 type:complete len:248 (+) Transcript_102092:713-1456(+)